MLLESGTLPVGVTVKGVRYQAFELRPPTINDNIMATLEVAEMQEGAGRGLKLSVAVLAQQLVSLATVPTTDAAPVCLPREEITLEMVLQLHPSDWDALLEAEARLKKKLLNGGMPLDGGTPCAPGACETASASAT
ncbi:MAG: hypothetical protein AB7P37_20640 [Ramlibacter sp.]